MPDPFVGEPEGYESRRFDTCDAEFWTLRGTILCTRVTGRGTGDFVRHFAAQADSIIATHGHVITFHDWREMLSYTPETRRELIGWTRNAGQTNPDANILIKSWLVTIGAQSAQLFLKNLHLYSNVQTFRRKMETVLDSLPAEQ